MHLTHLRRLSFLHLDRMNLSSIAGLENGSFFTAPSWVDLKQKPGATSITKSKYGKIGIFEYFNPVNFIFSPNLVYQH